MYISIKSFDLKNIVYNLFGMQDDIDTYIDTPTSHKHYDTVVERLKNEFGVSFYGFSNDANLIFDIVDENQLKSAAEKHSMPFRAIGEDEKIWILPLK